MCGIAGIVDLCGNNVEQKTLERMIRVLHHRGPDGAGMFITENVGLAHARLAVIDIAGGAQPMTSPDRQVALTYSGEVFNYVELRQQLRQLGHHFVSASDTEVVLQMYLAFGIDCVRYFNGEWAFALWDQRIRVLYLARDRCGARPLYYTIAGNRLIFGSEIKALLTHPAVSTNIDMDALYETFAYWSPLAPRTTFEGISELLPGSWLQVKAGKVDVVRYWHWDFSSQDATLDQHQSQEKLADLLESAVKVRMRADVRVASYLSGGIDSALLAAIASRNTSERLQTYSIRFQDSRLDEGQEQQQVVSFLNTEHNEVVCTPSDIRASLAAAVWHTEKPVLRTGALPMYILSREVSANAGKVVLSGEGADELFGGYDIFKEIKIRRFVQTRPESHSRSHLYKRLYGDNLKLRTQSSAFLSAYFGRFSTDRSDPLTSHRSRWQTANALQYLLAPEALLAMQLNQPDKLNAEWRLRLPQRFAEWDFFSKAQYIESVTLLPGYLLSSQCDRVAMAHGVESRLPYLDSDLIDFVCTVPMRLKMPALRDKLLLRSLAAGYLPKTITSRPKRPYRAPDTSVLLHSALVANVDDCITHALSPDSIKAVGLFKTEAVARLIRKAKMDLGHESREQMLLNGVITTQMLAQRFLVNRCD